MKKTLIAITFGLLSFQSFAACPAGVSKLTIGWEEWLPYQFKGADGKVTGLDVELIDAIFKKVGCPVEFKEVIWARVVEEVKNGSMSMASGASKNAEREAFANFSADYRKEEIAVFVRKGESTKYNINKLSDLTQGKLKWGITNGNSYGDEMDGELKKAEFMKYFEMVTSEEQNYPKVVKGRLDGLLADLYSGVSTMNEKGFKGQMEPLPYRVKNDEIYIMMSKKQIPADYIKEVNKAISTLKADGTLKKIFAKYLK